MPKSRFPALHSCFVSRHNIPLKKSICRKTAKVMRKFVIHWMFSRFYCCPLLRTPFGYFKQTYNTSIYPASFREIKSKYRVEKLSHIQLLEKNWLLVAWNKYLLMIWNLNKLQILLLFFQG